MFGSRGDASFSAAQGYHPLLSLLTVGSPKIQVLLTRDGNGQPSTVMRGHCQQKTNIAANLKFLVDPDWIEILPE